MERKRYAVLDAIRGVALINMIAYHAVWDLVYLFDLDWKWYTSSGGYLWQQGICWSFIVLSGFCQKLGRRPIRRGFQALLAGGAITVATLCFLPEDRVVFGVLTFLGSAMVFTALAEPLLQRCCPGIGLSISLLLFLLTKNVEDGYLGLFGATLFRFPRHWYRNLLTTYLGFPPKGFYSSDYFGLFPWLFLFLAGYYLYRLWERRGLLSCLEPSWIRPVEWLGRRSIAIYLLHQPVLYALLCLVF